METRQQLTTIGMCPIDLWADEPNRRAFIEVVLRNRAEEEAGERGKQVSKLRHPHDVSFVFGKMIAETAGPNGDLMESFAECAEPEATVVKVRACWWAE